jgi:hypothetical protein
VIIPPRDDHETPEGVFTKSLVGGGEGWIYALGHPRSNATAAPSGAVLRVWVGSPTLGRVEAGRL